MNESRTWEESADEDVPGSSLCEAADVWRGRVMVAVSALAGIGGFCPSDSHSRRPWMDRLALAWLAVAVISGVILATLWLARERWVYRRRRRGPRREATSADTQRGGETLRTEHLDARGHNIRCPMDGCPSVVEAA
jgi:hypothetical protein